MRPAVEAEKSGIPSVVIVTTGFATLGHLAAKGGGVEGLRLAEYPGAVGLHEPSAIADNVQKILVDQIIGGLTKSPELGSRTTAGAAWHPRRVVFNGSLEQINEFFSAKEWSDGLPIVPPTIERIEQFLSYTSLSANDEIAVLPPENLKAVPWNIAVNAVMAGCRPEHMPLLIAAVEALGKEKYHLSNIGTTSGLVPYVLINGPIVGQLAIQHGGQLVSRAPNTAIGRAIGLIIRNIAGFRPGKRYMGTFGTPSVFVLAEDSAASPWGPFHVEQGFNGNASTVTLGITNNWGPAPSPHSAPDKSAPQTILEMLCKEVSKKVRLVNFPERGPGAMQIMITLLVSPSVARSLAGAGYSKQDVKNYLYENARISLRDFEWELKYGSYPQQNSIREKVEAGLYPQEYLGKPNDRVRLLSSPDIVHIVVCGDASRNRMMLLEGAHSQPTTSEIRLPSNWDDLLK